ncbi:MAG TPA: hypothetical protein VIM52_01690, partial [Stellaceae bacterium]
MNPNPVTDIAGFLTRPGWMTAAFWFLLIASLAIANYVVVTIPWQRRFSHVAQGKRCCAGTFRFGWQRVIVGAAGGSDTCRFQSINRCRSRSGASKCSRG